MDQTSLVGCVFGTDIAVDASYECNSFTQQMAEHIESCCALSSLRSTWFLGCWKRHASAVFADLFRLSRCHAGAIGNPFGVKKAPSRGSSRPWSCELPSWFIP